MAVIKKGNASIVDMVLIIRKLKSGFRYRKKRKEKTKTDDLRPVVRVVGG